MPMPRNTARLIVVGFVVLVVTYAVAAWFVPSKLLIEIGDCFAIPMSLAAATIYFREVWNRPNEEAFTATDTIMIGIAGGWFTNALDRSARLWARLNDATIMDEPIIGLFLFMLMYFAALHVHVRGGSFSSSGVSMKGMSIVVAAIMASIALAGAVIYMELFL